jgi:hypothetical protein
MKITKIEAIKDHFELELKKISPQLFNCGVVERLSGLENEYKCQEDKIVLKIVEEIQQEKFCKFENRIEGLIASFRVGLFYCKMFGLVFEIEQKIN